MSKLLFLIAPMVLAVGCSTAPAPQRTAQQPGSALMPASDPSATPPEVPTRAAGLTIPSGATVRVRLASSLDTQRSRAGERFTATLDAPIIVDSKEVVPKGTTFTGHVTSSKSSGRLRGRALLGLKLDSFQLNGKTYQVTTTSISRASGAHKKRNMALIGGGSGLGAAIGALAGGGKGALIGAGAGAAAGTAGAAITGKKNVTLPAETLLTFRLQHPVQL